MNVAQQGSVGFEYFWQKETHATRSKRRGALRLMGHFSKKAEASDPNRNPFFRMKSGPDGFSLHGHRLSSLYRTNKTARDWLKQRNLVSFCQKYSNSVPSIEKVHSL